MLIGFILLGIAAWFLQMVLALRQFKKFNAHVKVMRSEGRVAIGKARGRIMAGAIVLFVIDDECNIIRGELLHGVTSFAEPRPFEKFNGINLLELTEELCKERKLDRQVTKAVIGARNDYELYQQQKAESIADSQAACSA